MTGRRGMLPILLLLQIQSAFGFLQQQQPTSIALFLTFPAISLAWVLPATSLPGRCPDIRQNILFTRAVVVQYVKKESKSSKNNENSNGDDAEDEARSSYSVNSSMEKAFQQLSSLQSWGTNENDVLSPLLKKPIEPLRERNFTKLDDNADPTPESEVQMYKSLIQELEQTNEDDLYNNVLKDMGGGIPSTRNNRIRDSSTQNPFDNTPSSPDSLMEQALNEALRDVQMNTRSSVDSVLNDKEIMREIEEIFQRGNEKLIESLEEMRREQQALAQASAQQNAQNLSASLSDDAVRLAQAEASMQSMLNRVNQETAQVEKAVEELREAQRRLDSSFLSKLQRGGLPKQSALVGLLLFSIRSIMDTVTAFSNESYLEAALLQGGIALLCAVAYVLL